MTALLTLSNITVAFSGRPVLQSIDFTLQKGEICTLIGPNGAGKSTLVNIMTGLLQPDSGTITRSPALTIGYVPQRLRLDASMPLKVSRFLSFADRSREHRQQALQQLNIAHLSEQQIHGLSGGELQRVLLARAMLRKPQLLVLDEPLQGVDVSGQASLYRLIASLRDSLGCAIVMVSHDLHLVMAQTDSVVCLNQHVCCHGKPESVSQHPEYLRLFGGAVADDLAVYTHHHDHQHDLHGDVVHNCGHDHNG
ncbi:zinc ABC transporter ATP-binding protein ZnuC [Teredinibacter purpureus]|uniref:zinc ABC transporter ATP-binding protein ZnuC n=1 Tax=Teredinibacter purpureus TaxID=2731756 RepID=UPI0005F8029B|nr:zinc ABC transporter ATP-binding protein ZnuC [Teredinibacter purpureus]